MSIIWVRDACEIEAPCIAVSFWYTFVYTSTHNLKNTSRLWMFYIMNDCSTIRDICLFSGWEVHAWYDWQVMAPNMHCSLFPISNLCVLPSITWKLQVVYGHSAYWMTALVSKTFLVWFRAAWQIQLKSYDPRHTLHSLSDTTLSCNWKPIHTLLFGMQLRMTAKLM